MNYIRNRLIGYGVDGVLVDPLSFVILIGVITLPCIITKSITKQ
ncbi:hypothetical protein [Psychrobacillus sp.]|nr:hypothetical protein [Psychrobacillus sp.]